MIDQWEAQLIAAPWVNQDKSVGLVRTAGVHEFDLGYVFWRVLPPGESEDVGSGRAVVDRRNGELTYWPSVPVPEVVEQYRAYREQVPVATLTWDPVVRARHLRVRAAFPENATHLRLPDGRVRISHSMRGEGTPRPHRLVAQFLDELPVAYRERGYERCSEVAAVSDALYAEEAKRSADVSLDSARTEVFRGADLVTYRIREPGDPTAGEPTPPCVSCQALLRHFGFALQGPEGAA
ncbi:YwqJ-related putative deaminase [Phytohabitans rumicis]|uniref:YwqJ-like deaminase n=1 Tax=Phytohabitans rumicis TaxID=1076125 RepID=A0A6V8LA01_9ACTN|nr:YwqJ-related putative deaminase [Phytohabitans rumicis]GFJ91838.1 hypothetical protein Prum_054800 [Phytohabitans rumicis]